MPLDLRPLKIRLVPGTWAYGIFASGEMLFEPADSPRWFEGNSSFRNKLESELKRHGVPFTIEVHEWDGANSVLSREEQAKLLATRLNDQRSEGVRRVVIAHSHGGNIACKASKLLEANGDDFAMVTLSTPFLQATSRREESPKVVLVLLFVLAGFLCFGAFNFSTGETAWLAGVWNYALGLLLFIPLFALRLWFAKYDDKDLAGAMNYGALVKGKLLVVRGFNDEATNAIGLGSIGMGLMNGFVYVLATPLRWMSANKFIFYLLPFLATAALATFLVNSVRIFQVISIWSTIAVLLALVLIPILVAGLFSSIFGREMFFQCLNLILTVDSVPDSQGNADVVTLPAAQLSMTGLRHGIYNHPRCAPLIANWLATGEPRLPELGPPPNVLLRPG